MMKRITLLILLAVYFAPNRKDNLAAANFCPFSPEDFEYCRIVDASTSKRSEQKEFFTVYQCQDWCLRSGCDAFNYRVDYSRGRNAKFDCRLYYGIGLTLSKTIPQCTNNDFYLAFIRHENFERKQYCEGLNTENGQK